MAQTELRRILEDEFTALAEPVRQMQSAVSEFWRHRDEPALSIWANIPVRDPVPDPPSGTISERQLYRQLMTAVKPALEARSYGFDNVPLLSAHLEHYTGPPPGTRFLPMVMGSQVTFPDSTPEGRRTGWNAGVAPLIRHLDDIMGLAAIQVSRSPLLAAVLRAFEEVSEIVQGRVPLTRYAPTLPLDFAADLIGHCQLYELLAVCPENAALLLDLCTTQWLEIIRLQARAAGGWCANHQCRPGIYVHDMILPFLSPAIIRRTVIPYNRRLSEALGGLSLHINHPDPQLLADFTGLPAVHGFGVQQAWPAAPVVAALRGRSVLAASFDWHYHPGRPPAAPVCISWDECCARFSGFAGQLRVQASLSGWGETPQQQLDCVLRDRDDLLRLWEEGVGC